MQLVPGEGSSLATTVEVGPAQQLGLPLCALTYTTNLPPRFLDKCLSAFQLTRVPCPSQWVLPAGIFQERTTEPTQENKEVFEGPPFAAGGYGWCAAPAAALVAPCRGRTGSPVGCRWESLKPRCAAQRDRTAAKLVQCLP